MDKLKQVVPLKRRTTEYIECGCGRELIPRGQRITCDCGVVWAPSGPGEYLEVEVTCPDCQNYGVEFVTPDWAIRACTACGEFSEDTRAMRAVEHAWTRFNQTVESVVDSCSQCPFLRYVGDSPTCTADGERTLTNNVDTSIGDCCPLRARHRLVRLREDGD